MAKIIWWLTVIICAMTNHLNPFHMEEISFSLDKYYTSTLGVDDPTAIYASFFDIDAEMYQPCNPSNMALAERFGKAVAGDKSNTVTYFVVPTGDKSSYNIPPDTVVPIVAPLNGYISTDPAGSIDSTYMTFVTTVDDYTIELFNMECWYCCYGHKKYNGAGYKHCNVSKDDYKNRIIQAGQVIGFANSETSIAIKDSSGEYINFDTFFSQDAGYYTTLLDNVNREAANAATTN